MDRDINAFDNNYFAHLFSLPSFLSRNCEKFNFKNYTYDSKTQLLSTDNSYRNYNDYVEIDE